MKTADPIHDQAMAAFAEAVRQTETLPGAVDIKKTPITTRVLSKWARGGPFEHGVVMHNLGLLPDGRWGSSVDWTSCGHLPTPQLCYGLGNWPGHLMCADCLATNAELSENDCDWCGASPQVDDRVTLYPAVYPIGPAIVLFALCDDHIVQGDCGAYKGVTLPRHTADYLYR